jgi:hypothetical protein
MRVIDPSNLRTREWNDPSGSGGGAYEIAQAIASSPWFQRSGMNPQALMDAGARGADMSSIMGAGNMGMQNVQMENQLDEQQRKAEMEYLAKIKAMQAQERMSAQDNQTKRQTNDALLGQQAWAKQGDWGLGREKLASAEKVATGNKGQDWAKFMLGEQFHDRRQDKQLEAQARIAETTKESPIAKTFGNPLMQSGIAIASEALREPNHPIVRTYWPIAQQLGDNDAEKMEAFGRILMDVKSGKDPGPKIKQAMAQREAARNPQPSWWQRTFGGQ